MRHDQLDGLVVFVTVAQLQGFSAAAVRLGMSPSAVSQAIRQLENRLGVALFNRTTRSIALTDAGMRFLERAQAAVQTLMTAGDDLGNDPDNPSGQLRLNVSRAGFMIVLRPLLAAFLRTHPRIRLEVTLDNALVDIVAPGFDAGIRFGHLVEKDMVGVPVGPRLSAFVVASPEYLARRGTPVHPRDLVEHDCIGFRHAGTGMIERWALQQGSDVLELAIDGPLIVNDSSALVHAALDGIGIAYMINGYLEPLIEAGRLVRVLRQWSPDLPGFSLYYPDRKRTSQPLRAFVNFLAQSRIAGAAVGDRVFL